MSIKFEEAEDILKKYGQEHILNGYEKLDNNYQNLLLKQIETIDFELVNSLYKNTDKKYKTEGDKITPIDYLDKYKLNDEYKYYENIGKKAIMEKRLAAVTMAGGQGTRLGHTGPKGTFKVQTVNGEKYIFEILCEIMKDANKEYGVEIPSEELESITTVGAVIKYMQDKGVNA